MLLAELPLTAEGRARRLVGLPGNPLAAVAGTVTLALPLLRRLAGRPDPPRHCRCRIPGPPRDTRLQPVGLVARTAVLLAFAGPAMLRGPALADGLAVVPPGGVAAGATVEVMDVLGQ